MTDEQKDELIRRALLEARGVEMRQNVQQIDRETLPEWSVHHKRRMNRIFRVHGGFKKAFYPEVDSPFRYFSDRLGYWVQRVLDRIVKWIKA